MKKICILQSLRQGATAPLHIEGFFYAQYNTPVLPFTVETQLLV